MKTVKQILEHRTVIKTGILTESKKLKKADETKVPTVIVLQRKAIRMFPDDQKIALYYSQALGKHVSIPFGPKNDALGIHLSEETLDEENVLDYLPGYSSSRKDFIRRSKEPLSKNIEDFVKGAPEVALSGLGAGKLGATGKAIGGAVSSAKEYAKRKAQELAKKRAESAAKRAAEKKAKESPLGGSKETFEKGVPKKGSGKGPKEGRLRRWVRRGAGAVATGLGLKAAWDALGADRDPRGAFKSAEGEHQFGRELAKVGSSSQAQSTVDPSAAKQQLRAFDGPQGYYRESTNLSKIKTIVENKTKKDEITFQDGKSVEITERVAKKILGIYESLNKDNKKNLEKMLNEDIVSFRKVVNFAIRQ